MTSVPPGRSTVYVDPRPSPAAPAPSRTAAATATAQAPVPQERVSPEPRSWTRIATFAEEPGADFSYPFLMQASNGDVHLLYAWKREAIRHVVFNTAWLDGWITRRWQR